VRIRVVAVVDRVLARAVAVVVRVERFEGRGEVRAVCDLCVLRCVVRLQCGDLARQRLDLSRECLHLRGEGGPQRNGVGLRFDDWEWVLGVDLWGPIHGVRTFLPILMQQDEAHIVSTASTAGLAASPAIAAYKSSR
jgi:NAD(P)-dependent dehydrogenase (short-subunit alcohol dehydrogenase family)